MTKILASAKNLDEVKILLNSDTHIIDLKQPEKGALGGLPVNLIEEIVRYVNHNKVISATIGDLPMIADSICQAVLTISQTRVDYIKIGIFPNGNLNHCLTKLSDLKLEKQKMIAVLFADTQPNLKLISQIKQAGFEGVMLDTMDKTKGSLPQLMNQQQLSQFIQEAHAQHLITGLAGSLRAQDISSLLPLNSDYLGFRTALCHQHQRKQTIDTKQVNKLISYFR